MVFKWLKKIFLSQFQKDKGRPFWMPSNYYYIHDTNYFVHLLEAMMLIVSFLFWVPWCLLHPLLVLKTLEYIPHTGNSTQKSNESKKDGHFFNLKLAKRAKDFMGSFLPFAWVLPHSPIFSDFIADAGGWDPNNPADDGWDRDHQVASYPPAPPIAGVDEHIKTMFAVAMAAIAVFLFGLILGKAGLWLVAPPRDAPLYIVLPQFHNSRNALPKSTVTRWFHAD